MKSRPNKGFFCLQMGKSRKAPAWMEADAPWRVEAQELKNPDNSKQNSCDSPNCRTWMSKFDIHKLCFTCRASDCNGEDVFCKQCRSDAGLKLSWQASAGP